MKYRQGFVSNSSSSSYIIGVGKIIDEYKFKEYCKTNYIDYDIYTVQEILNNRSISRYRNDKYYFYNESFDYNSVSLEIDSTKLNDKYVTVSYAEDITEDPGGDTNYDIDSTDFEPIGQSVFDIGEQVGVKNFEYVYGAGRNG